MLCMKSSVSKIKTKEYIIDLLDVRRQRLTELLIKHLISRDSYDSEVRMLNSAKKFIIGRSV